MTVSPSRPGTATTRSDSGSPYGRPSSRTPLWVRPVRTASATGSSGTSRSAPGDAATIRPWALMTWTTAVPAATGTGSGSRLASTSAATSRAVCRAELSRPRFSVMLSVPISRMATPASETARPAAAVSVSRARRLRRRHQTTSPCGRRRVPESRVTGPRIIAARRLSPRPWRAGIPPRAASAGPPARTARRSCAAGSRRRPRPR